MTAPFFAPLSMIPPMMAPAAVLPPMTSTSRGVVGPVHRDRRRLQRVLLAADHDAVEVHGQVRAPAARGRADPPRSRGRAARCRRAGRRGRPRPSRAPRGRRRARRPGSSRTTGRLQHQRAARCRRGSRGSRGAGRDRPCPAIGSRARSAPRRGRRCAPTGSPPDARSPASPARCAARGRRGGVAVAGVAGGRRGALRSAWAGAGRRLGREARPTPGSAGRGRRRRRLLLQLGDALLERLSRSLGRVLVRGPLAGGQRDPDHDDECGLRSIHWQVPHFVPAHSTATRVPGRRPLPT